MNKKQKADYIVLFKGAKLSKRNANIVGLSIIFGFIGIFISIITVGLDNKIACYAIISIFILIGYFLGWKIFKK